MGADVFRQGAVANAMIRVDQLMSRSTCEGSARLRGHSTPKHTEEPFRGLRFFDCPLRGAVGSQRLEAYRRGRECNCSRVPKFGKGGGGSDRDDDGGNQRDDKSA